MSRRNRKNQKKTSAQKREEFAKNFRTYLIMSIFFVVINVAGGSGHFWAIYPIAGWGLGIAMQYFSLYGRWKDPEVYEEDIEEFDINQRPRRYPERERMPDLRENYREDDLV